jgi:hypothetical protein
MKSPLLSIIKSPPVLFGVTPWLLIIVAYAAAFPYFWARGAW